MAELNDKIINFKDLSWFKTRYDEKIENENKILKANIKALEYVVNNSNRLNYTGQVITNSNSVVGDIKKVIINGNTRYKKSDGTYTDTWESGVTLESVGETEKNSDGKYPVIIKSSNDTKEDKRTILLENPLRKNGSISDFADLEKKEVTRNCGVKILDGSEIWGKENLTRTNTSLFYLSLTSSIFAKVGKCLSDKLSYNYGIYSTDEEGIRIDMNGNLQISILKSKLATDNVTGFKTWLVSNNVTVVYQLATPTTESIEVSPTDNPLTSYTPSTTLTTNNVVKGNISADMPTNVNSIIVNQASEIAKLQNSLLETQALLIDNTITEI